MNLELLGDNLFKGLPSAKQLEGINAILKAIGDERLNLGMRAAYILATAYHETARTMQPIEEYGKGKNRTYGYNFMMSGKKYFDTKNVFYGRGFVQLTWYENYDKIGKKFGEDFIQHPERVMDIDIAAKILVKGMLEGWFTGKKFDTYIKDGVLDYVKARRIINGTDRAELIAGYAAIFRECL